MVPNDGIPNATFSVLENLQIPIHYRPFKRGLCIVWSKPSQFQFKLNTDESRKGTGISISSGGVVWDRNGYFVAGLEAFSDGFFFVSS